MAGFDLSPLLAIFLTVFLSVCEAGDYCNDVFRSDFGRYCTYGCCYDRYDNCCTSPVGLIVGLCVGGGVLLFVTIIVICICRRRRLNNGFVYGASPGQAVVVQSSTTSSGVVNTSGVQPGVMYPPQPYPGNYQPYSGPGYPGYPPQGQGYAPYPQAYPPQPNPGYAAGPPTYDSVANTGGVDNAGFNKN